MNIHEVRGSPKGPWLAHTGAHTGAHPGAAASLLSLGAHTGAHPGNVGFDLTSIFIYFSPPIDRMSV